MGWERRRGGLYYYRARRVGRRVVKEYVGPGIVGMVAEEDDQAERQERAAARQAEMERREKERAQLAADPLAALSASLDSLVSSTLTAAGYHRHRGEWRRARCRTR